jgi:hypothetical protein
MYSGTGRFRVRGRGARRTFARVVDINIAIDVDETVYQARGYQPPFEELPWQTLEEASAAERKKWRRPGP